jgi:hypothetical protein
MSTDNVANPITLNSITVEVTPVLDTSEYADGDTLGAPFAIAGACRREGLDVVLADVTVLDKAKQSTAIDIMFFRSLPTVASADNAAINISDAEMEKCIGGVSIAAADFKALSASSYANPAPFNKLLSPAANSTVLYGQLVCRSGTPTYAASSLVIKFKFLQD